jgi:hypothetical protein
MSASTYSAGRCIDLRLRLGCSVLSRMKIGHQAPPLSVIVRTIDPELRLVAGASLCGSGAGWATAVHRADGRVAQRAPSAPRPGRRGSGAVDK